MPFPDDREGAAATFRERLERMSSLLGRFRYISRLFDPANGRYSEPTAGEVLSSKGSHRFLAEAHQQAFEEWISLPLEQKHADWKRCFLDNSEDLQLWLAIEAYRNLVPAGAAEPERLLFFCGLEAILAVVRNECAESSDRRVQLMLDSARQHFGDPRLTLKALSKLLGASENHLGLLFHRRTGLPFRRYLRRVRIARAVELLGAAKTSVKEISAILGYTDPANFVHEFRAELKISPGWFRRRIPSTRPNSL